MAKSRLRCFLIVFYLGISGLIVKGNVPSEERLLKRIDQAFNLQKYDACITLYYNLIHQAKNQNNTLMESKYWFHLSWIQDLNEYHQQANASRVMARQCFKNTGLLKKDTLLLWENISNGIHYYQTDDYVQSLQFLKNCTRFSGMVNSRMTLFIQAIMIDWEYTAQPKKLCKPKILTYIRELQQKKDTAWFGYALANMSLAWCFYEEINYTECIKKYELAISTFEKLKIESPDWMACYFRLLSAYYYANQNNQRSELFKSIINKIEKSNLPPQVLIKYYTLKGGYFAGINNYQEAIDAYLRGVEIRRKLNNGIPYSEFEDVFTQYYFLGDYSKAIEWMNKNPDQHLTLSDKCILALCYDHLKSPQLASDIIKFIEAQNPPKDIYYLKTLNSLVTYFKSHNNYIKIQKYQEKVLLWYIKNYGRIHKSTSWSYNSLAWVHFFTSGNYGTILELYHKAIYSLINQPYNPDIYSIPDITKTIDDNYLIYNLTAKATTFHQFTKTNQSKKDKIKNLKAAIALYKLAFDVAFKYKLNLQKEDQKMVYATFSKYYFRNAVEILQQLYEITGDKIYSRQMFEYTEKSKASLLLSMVREVKAKKLRLIPDDLSQKEEDIRSRTEVLVQTRAKAYETENPDRAKIDGYNAALYHLQVEQDSLFAFYKKKYPAYYNAKFNSEVVSVDSLQKRLSPSQVLVQYLIGNSVMTTFLVSRYQYQVYRQTIDSTFFKNLKAYHKRMESFSYNDLKDTTIRFFAKLSNGLYQQLLAPVASSIKGKNLIIIPDEALTYLPFETLVTDLPKTNKKPDYRDLAYLIKTNPVSYDYSASLFVMNGGHQNIKNPSLLAMAPSYQNLKIPDISKKDMIAMRGDTGNISTIAGTYEEVKGIRKIFGGKSLLKDKATEERFKEEAQNYDILHLAMHGMVNNEYPMFSKLVFTHSNDSSNEGFLNTYEIYNLKLNASLVVLSACNSGNGKLYGGEGLISLARGFFTAGAKSVVMTLWSIADKTSQRLMNLFYANLSHHTPIANALQKAKTDYLKNSDPVMAHPYFWAGFIVTGNSTTTFDVSTEKEPVYWMIGLILILFSGFMGWRYFRQH